MIDTDTKARSKSLPRFVAVIFGNGEDDDTPGLQAACDNDAVQVDGRVFEPGEDILIYDKHLLFYRQIATSPMGRNIYITQCRLEYRGPNFY